MWLVVRSAAHLSINLAIKPVRRRTWGCFLTAHGAPRLCLYPRFPRTQGPKGGAGTHCSTFQGCTPGSKAFIQWPSQYCILIKVSVCLAKQELLALTAPNSTRVAGTQQAATLLSWALLLPQGLLRILAPTSPVFSHCLWPLEVRALWVLRWSCTIFPRKKEIVSKYSLHMWGGCTTAKL